MHGIANIRTVFFALLSFASLVCAQNPTLPTTPPTPKRSAPVDPNKYCVVINGAGGDAAYASQFESWTTELTSILNARFGFGSNHLRVLSEKSADGLHATADNVKQTFTLLRSELQPENVLFVFFIGHGSYDGKQCKLN